MAGRMASNIRGQIWKLTVLQILVSVIGSKGSVLVSPLSYSVVHGEAGVSVSMQRLRDIKSCYQCDHHTVCHLTSPPLSNYIVRWNT